MQTVIQGDSLSVMAGIEADSVDMCFADPPYYRVKAEALRQ